MRHLCQIGDDRFAINVFAQCERNFGVSLCLFPVRLIARVRAVLLLLFGCSPVRCPPCLSRDRRENIDSFGACGSSEVPLQAYDLVHTHAFGWIHFVAGDGWALCDIARRTAIPNCPKSQLELAAHPPTPKDRRCRVPPGLCSSSKSIPGRT
jgi:hypothetical protein